ncbi:metal ABC transporter substrate-binding protein [Pseudoroseicyclus aestuarii]|uniref:ABC-type Zn uptake system ZnuABC Zn-binding protein ZnuA n=1 Tax=Pseudoroseicyclus aestuarii TaxID=1795041 RepID=A0A318T1E8_9RHOB|nr:metal ABC transporter substrate-binding protein [Pseudoroseicyclus aestuarii]PYE85807.1 ABC-type Zn uptake system ZnuABC Zn-binding protein ZnuA [Pseudoroseicyclus aestuarii]
MADAPRHPIRTFLLGTLVVCGGAVVASALLLGGPGGASDDRFKVVTTFTVIADMARNVAGDAAEVASITRPGAEIHGYEPTPRDVLQAEGADLILWNGFGLERWFEQFLNNVGDIPSATLTQGVDPIPIGSGDYEGRPNPHAWMGLDTAMIYIDNIEAALSEHDPGNAALYAANAEAYRTRIRDTLEPLRQRVLEVPEDQRWLVSCEGAFSYLARDFDMKELYLWPINADQTGTPQQVRRVVDTVESEDIPVVFCESTVSQRPAEQVARETGARYGGMLYVDSLSTAEGPVPTYLDLLQRTAGTVADGLTGTLGN